MNEIILELAALLMTLFCLVCSVTVRRDLYTPLPRGLHAALTSQHFIFLAMLVSVIISAASSVAVMLGELNGAGAPLLMALNVVYYFFHNTLCYFFALYILDLSGPVKDQRPWFFAVFCLPLLIAELLILTTPFTHLCFYVDEALTYHRGSGLWILYAIAAVYAVTGVLYLARFGGSLSRTDRSAALVLVVVALTGVVIQAIWSVPAELFFEAIAFFGYMVLLEHDDDSSEHGISSRFRISVIAAIALTFLVVIVTDVLVIRGLFDTQSEQIGNTRLDIISGDLQDTISGAEADVLRVSMGAEQLLDAGASREELARYFAEQKKELLQDESFMNVFIAGKDWHIVPDFDAPPDFHASERLWYIGAAENPGEVYITEPYIDADTGAMCFTVSRALSDGETVVGMDLNFSKAQESILRMTNGTDQTAMIVTPGGLIAGYTDMSLVGQRADEKLPEFAEILQRVTNSNEHDSFHVRLGGRPCTIFSSETSSHWYLILAVDTGTLNAESYRQMVLMASITLLMLLIVVVFYMISTRNRMRTAAAMAENRSFITGLSERLRDPVSRILKLSDLRLLGDNADPTLVIGQIRSSGMELSELSDSIRDYAAVMQAEAERMASPAKKRRAAAAEAPSLRLRNGIIIVLLIGLLSVLFLCYRTSNDFGVSRMNREADSYENQLGEWITQQQSLLYMFTDLISSRPELLDDYDGAVQLLDDIARHYPEISLCYMANPYKDPPVIMNNGWIPGDDYRPETRPWYRATERSPSHFSISAPYLDAQFGTYCITLSRVVYGENDEFLGIFGIDFFLDKLISVLGESYTSQSYAFLVDSDGDIINHPNSAYQMTESSSVSIEDTEYADAYHSRELTVLRDYSGHMVTCLSRRTDSGFTVIVANRWWSIYGSSMLISLAFLALFGFCILVIVLLINRLLRWQEEVNAQLVEAADAAMEAGRAKSQFLAQMSHEIRTPMNAIIGLENIALRDPDLTPRTREQLEKIGASARHLLELINDILDMSRIESGRMVLKADEFSLRDFLDQINVIINGQCADKGLTYECSVIGQTDRTFVGDDLKLKQVLINILGNSVKFTDAPGLVSFTVRQTDCTDEDCSLIFTMKDTGIGMDKEFIPRLFEAFSQEDGTKTNRYGGSGLGMAITKSIVEMMGGSIAVESEKGVGSTFTVTVRLKRASGAGEAEAEAEEAETSLAGVHVLIAEDNELNAEILTDLLELEDITSEWAENGKLAVERFAESEPGHFDAVLMDMRMPVMDGLEAAAALRKLDHPDAATIPIIALTANAFEEDVQQCLRAGMDMHMSKPVDIELLKKNLSRLLSGR